MEFEQFGWNVLTISFFGTVATNLLGLWGTIDQAREIWGKRSGRSVSVIMHTYTATMLTAAAVYGLIEYGLSVPRDALMVNLVRVPAFVAVLIGLWKYRGFTVLECILCMLFIGTVVVMVFVPFRGEYLIVLFVGGWLTFLPQTWKIWKHGRGAVSLWFLGTTAIGVSFWTVYAFALDDLPMKMTNPVFLVIVSATLLLWVVKGKRTAAEASR